MEIGNLGWAGTIVRSQRNAPFLKLHARKVTDEEQTKNNRTFYVRGDVGLNYTIYYYFRVSVKQREEKMSKRSARR